MDVENVIPILNADAAVNSRIYAVFANFIIAMIVWAWNGDGCANFLLATGVLQAQIHSSKFFFNYSHPGKKVFANMFVHWIETLLFLPQTILMSSHSKRWRSLWMKMVDGRRE